MIKGLTMGLIGVTLAFAVGIAAAQELNVSKEDALIFENLSLKVKLHEANVDRLQRDIQQVSQDLQRQRDEFSAHFTATYGVPIERVRRQDGKWIVTPSPTGEK